MKRKPITETEIIDALQQRPMPLTELIGVIGRSRDATHQMLRKMVFNKQLRVIGKATSTNNKTSPIYEVNTC